MIRLACDRGDGVFDKWRNASGADCRSDNMRVLNKGNQELLTISELRCRVYKVSLKIIRM